MKKMKGANHRTHFRLDMEKEAIGVTIQVNDNNTITGSIKDVSNGGLSFTLNGRDMNSLVGKEVKVMFVIAKKTFAFNMKVLRQIQEGSNVYYAGQFVEESKIKKSQLSLLLMKLKLMEDATNPEKES